MNQAYKSLSAIAQKFADKQDGCFNIDPSHSQNKAPERKFIQEKNSNQEKFGAEKKGYDSLTGCRLDQASHPRGTFQTFFSF